MTHWTIWKMSDNAVTIMASLSRLMANIGGLGSNKKMVTCESCYVEQRSGLMQCRSESTGGK